MTSESESDALCMCTPATLRKKLSSGCSDDEFTATSPMDASTLKKQSATETQSATDRSVPSI